MDQPFDFTAYDAEHTLASVVAAISREGTPTVSSPAG